MKLRHILAALSVFPLVIFLNLIAYFAAFAITVMTGGVNVLDSGTAMVNQGIFNIVRYTLIFVIFGFIYYKGFFYGRDNSISDQVKNTFKILLHPPVSLLFFILGGLGIQVGTDAVLYILGTLFPTTFASYSHMMETFTGSKSTLFISTTILLAPLAEELVFRGVCLKYLSEFLENKKRGFILAILIQAFLFGLYHGNLIQMIYAFIFGIVLGLIAAKYKNIIPSTILHMVINGSLYLLPENFFKNLPFAIIMIVISFLVTIASLIYIIKLPDSKSK